MATRRMFPFSIQKIAVSTKFSVWKNFSICALTVFTFCSLASAQTKSILPGISLPHIYRGLGITVDGSGNYATVLEQYNYMIGPQYKWEFNRFRFIAHGLYGRAQTRLRQPGRPTSIGFLREGWSIA